MTTDKTLAQLRWHCRRGMKELDLMLLAFFDGCYHNLSDSEQQSFTALLDHHDQDLFAWFLGHESCPDNALAPLISQIRDYCQTTNTDIYR